MKMKMERMMEQKQRKWAPFRSLSLLLLLFMAVLLPSWAAPTRIGCDGGGGRYNTSGGPVPGKINVHLVAHTHDDVGWLKTVDQYYIGSNNAIQVAAVEYILDSVIDGLLKDKNRKFIYVEQAFFQRWWRQQSKETHAVVKNLVKSGQLEFINGGWCMHDEATTHYIDMIDQTTLGHRFIKEQFNKTPRIGWQIDPFGHSAVQAYLLGAEVGFDAVFFARADYQDIAQRREEKKMEVIWRGSKTLAETSQIFAGVLANHYSPPTGFNFDVKSEDPPIQDDQRLFDYNVNDRVDLFVQRAQQQSRQFRTNHIMWTMGEDFAYEYAETWFKQLDKLIHYVNKDGRVNAFYSTPSMYVDAKNAANEKWPIKEEDFFPYADSPNGYWTGYFTSRPSLKGYVRKLSGILQAARQLESFIGRKGGGPNTDSLEEAMAVLQHHDGVSGTEQQHVANDYATRLAAASIEAAEVMNSGLASIISSKGRQIPAEGGAQMNESDSEILSEDHILLYSDQSRTSATSESLITLEQCPLLNVSICPPSENFPRDNSILVVVAYNSLGWERKEFVRVPVSSEKLEIFDSSGNSVTSQIVPLSSAARQLRSQYANADETSDDKPIYLLTFSCNVPPLGYSSYFIKASAMNSAYIAKQSLVQDIRFDNEIIIQSSSTQLHFSNSTGLLNQIKTSDGTVVSMKQFYCWYKASDGYTRPAVGQASGAYVFRPTDSNCVPVVNKDKSVISVVVRGPVVEEVHQQFSSWLSQVVRVYKNDEHAEIEFFVGPIPIDDGLGKEIVTKLTSSISSNKVFYTDSNGRDFIRRIRDYRHDWNLKVYEPIAGNYYPINSGIYLSDNVTDFSMLVDRAVGGSSIVDGELELMLHRRLLHDDGKGVAEALNEIVCLSGSEDCEGLVVEGTFYVSISDSEKASQWRRNLIQRVLSPLQLAFSIIPDEDFSLKTPEFSFTSSAYQLPPNVAVITLQELRDSSILLRLAHLYEINESKDLSTVARVKLSLLFAGRKIKEIVEMSLSANQKKSEMKNLKWQVADEDEDETNHIPFRSRPLAEGEDIIELGPMEIRTFNIFFS